MSDFRIIDYCYPFDSSVGLSALSQDAAFPVTNLRRHHVSRVYRSSGYFLIDATNSYLNFKESGGGAEKIATLTAGAYTGATLAAEIKRAMDAAGTVVYTVSYGSTTGLWTIATAGAFLSLLWLTGTNAATSVGAAIGFDVTVDDTGAVTYTGAALAIHTEERVTIDLRTAEDIDSFAMLFDKRYGHKFTPAAVIKLQGNPTAYWTSPAVDVTLSYDTDWGIMSHFLSSVPAQQCRYWSVRIVDPRNPNLYVEIPKIILGKATQLSQVPQAGFKHSRRDLSQIVATDYGVRYTDIYPIQRKIGFTYVFLPDADVKLLELIFERVGCVTPILLVLDSQEVAFDKDRFAIYGYMSDRFDTGHEFSTYFATDLTVEEAL